MSELAQLGLVARVRGGVRPLQRGQSEVAFDLRLRIELVWHKDNPSPALQRFLELARSL